MKESIVDYKNNLPKLSLKTAVLFLIFNRLDTTKEVFESIRKAKPPRLYIASDGPRNNEEYKKIKQVRDYVLENINWNCQIKTLFREKNKGCKYAVSEAITWFFENEEQGIILEDDCVPSQSFFWFCEDLLEKYKKDLRVWHIGGTNPLDASEISNQYYFSEYNRIWGWATWRRAWNKYDVEIKDWPDIKNSNILENMLGKKQKNKYEKIFDRVYENKIDTWDYQWFLIRLLNGKAIIPKVNLITNIGFGEQATHTLDENNFLANRKRGEIEFPLESPRFFTVDFERDKKWENISNDKNIVINFFKKILSRCIN